MGSRIQPPPTAFRNTGKHSSSIVKSREKSDGHLAFIRTLPCLVTGKTGVEAAHISYGDNRFGKPAKGYGSKADDRWVVPLSPAEHRKQHDMDEEQYWIEAGIDPCIVALALWGATGDRDTAIIILKANKT